MFKQVTVLVTLSLLSFSASAVILNINLDGLGDGGEGSDMLLSGTGTFNTETRETNYTLNYIITAPGNEMSLTAVGRLPDGSSGDQIVTACESTGSLYNDCANVTQGVWMAYSYVDNQINELGQGPLEFNLGFSSQALSVTPSQVPIPSPHPRSSMALRLGADWISWNQA